MEVSHFDHLFARGTEFILSYSLECFLGIRPRSDAPSAPALIMRYYTYLMGTLGNLEPPLNYSDRAVENRELNKHPDA